MLQKTMIIVSSIHAKLLGFGRISMEKNIVWTVFDCFDCEETDWNGVGSHVIRWDVKKDEYHQIAELIAIHGEQLQKYQDERFKTVT